MKVQAKHWYKIPASIHGFFHCWPTLSIEYHCSALYFIEKLNPNTFIGREGTIHLRIWIIQNSYSLLGSPRNLQMYKIGYLFWNSWRPLNNSRLQPQKSWLKVNLCLLQYLSHYNWNPQANFLILVKMHDWRGK